MISDKLTIMDEGDKIISIIPENKVENKFMIPAIFIASSYFVNGNNNFIMLQSNKSFNNLSYVVDYRNITINNSVPATKELAISLLNEFVGTFKTSGSGGSSEKTTVVNSLDSTSTTDALSANMGRVLDVSIGTLEIKITDVDTQLDNLEDQSTAKWIILNQTETRSKKNETDIVTLNDRTNNLDNTSDMDKPLSTAQQAYIDSKDELQQTLAEKGLPNGYAPLDDDGYVPAEFIPPNDDNRTWAEGFINLQDGIDWLLIPANKAKVKVGDGFKFEDIDTPDYWYNGTTLIAEKANTNLTNYYSIAQADLLFDGKATKLAIPQNCLPRRAAAGTGEADSWMEYSPLAQPSTLVRRDAGGRINIAAPVSAENGATKQYVDTVAADTKTAMQAVIDTSIELPEFDSINYKFTFRNKKGETKIIDLPIELLAAKIAYDPTTKKITLTLENGSKTEFSIADLVDVYKGSTGSEIQISVVSNEIRATILNDSITEAKLVAAIRQKLADAVTHAADTVKHVTAAERKKWDDGINKSLFLVNGTLSNLALTQTPQELVLPTKNKTTRGGDITLDVGNINRFVFAKDGIVRIRRRINITGGLTRVIKYEVRKNGAVNLANDYLDCQTRYVGNSSTLMYIDAEFVFPVLAGEKYSIYGSITTTGTQNMAYYNGMVSVEYV